MNLRNSSRIIWFLREDLEVRNETSCGVVGPKNAQHNYRKNLTRHVIKSVPSVIYFGMKAVWGGLINTHWWPGAKWMKRTHIATLCWLPPFVLSADVALNANPIPIHFAK